MNDFAPAPHDPPLTGGALEAGVQVGDFRIERRLGAGGMGIVYQARQVSLNRPVALKVLGQALTRNADLSRFQREAQAAARLRHPAIAQVYYIGQDRHLCYLAMELIDGSSLRRVLDRLGTTTVVESGLDSMVREDLAEAPAARAVRFDQPTEDSGKDSDASPSPEQEVNPYLSPQARELRTSAAYVRRAAEIIRDAAQALAHAHDQGVVHRDIKPDNLLLDRQGKVHLIDFGVARFFDDQAVTYTGQLVGTPLYMSPEQVTGRGGIDARTDIYSLGLVLYELLTLRPPIEATNRENLLRTIVTKPLPPVSWRNAAVPGDLERIAHKATQKDPDERYARATDLAADLDCFLAGKAVAAPPYHFRLDEREITAARPGWVVLAAVNFFVTSVFLFLAFTSFLLMLLIMMSGMLQNQNISLGVAAIQLAVTIGMLVAGIAIGQGILAARPWARWVGIASSALFTLSCVVGLVLLAISVTMIMSESFERLVSDPPPPGGDNTIAMSPQRMLIGSLMLYAVPLVAGIILGGTAFWGLVCRAASQWFRMAGELRAEHRRLRDSLAKS